MAEQRGSHSLHHIFPHSQQSHFCIGYTMVCGRRNPVLVTRESALFLLQQIPDTLMQARSKHFQFISSAVHGLY